MPVSMIMTKEIMGQIEVGGEEASEVIGAIE
jgi:hypothetical protein